MLFVIRVELIRVDMDILNMYVDMQQMFTVLLKTKLLTRHYNYT